MRLVHVLVPDEHRGPVIRALVDRDIEYVVLEDSDEEVLLEFPIPADASGEILGALDDAGLGEDAYTVVGSVETASTPTIEELMNRYAGTYDPLPVPELRSKARDLSRDPMAYVGMVFLSAVIAAAGLLVGSPAVVVGSMVIAPFVGPVLTTSVGVVSGDDEMFRDSLVFQAGGLAVAVLAAGLFGALVRTLYLVPPTLEIEAIDLVASRAAPNFLTVAVGAAAGSAAAFGLTTKGPTALIGVMIAAALVPAAAVVGLALVWERPVVAAGSLVTVTVTFVAINLAVYVTLLALGYSSGDVSLPSGQGLVHTAVIVAAVLLVVAAIGAALYGTYMQVTFERSTNKAIQDVLDEPRYDDLGLASVSIGYTGSLVGSGSATVTVAVRRSADRNYPNLARALRRSIVAETGRRSTVQVRFVDFQRATGGSSQRAVLPGTTRLEAPPLGTSPFETVAFESAHLESTTPGAPPVDSPCRPAASA